MRPLGGILALTLATAAAPAAASEPAGPVAIAFQETGATPAPQAAGILSMTGPFSMTGSFADAGTVRTDYRLAGRYIGATSTVMGARGIFTISQRGTMGPVVNGHRSAAGRWRLCGGTGMYRHARASGLWDAVADVGAAPTGMTAPTMRGGFYGRLARGRTPRPPGSLGVSCTPGVT